jgi:hypothetical protein
VRYLLDTCVISEVTKKRPSARARPWLDAQDELTLFLSVITLGALQQGVSKLPASKAARTPATMGCAGAYAPLYWPDPGRGSGGSYAVGAITATAEQQGQPVPVLDGLLAATALVAGLTLVTRTIPHMQATSVPLFDPWAR